jgi:putative resolvase
MNPTKFVSPAQASKDLGVPVGTLRSWATRDKIEFILTAGGQRRYNANSVCAKRAKPAGYTQIRRTPDERQTSASPQQASETKDCRFKGAIYCRVSSWKQKDDLERQISAVQARYPKHTVYKDVCSGLKYKRKGLTRLLGHVQSGVVQEVVVAHKDRLARFGTELIE